MGKLLKSFWFELMRRFHAVNAQLLLEQGRPVEAATQMTFSDEYATELFRMKL